MIFDVVNTLLVIDISKGKINTIAIDNPTFVVLSNFLNVFIIFDFYLFINFIIVSFLPFKILFLFTSVNLV